MGNKWDFGMRIEGNKEQGEGIKGKWGKDDDDDGLDWDCVNESEISSGD